MKRALHSFSCIIKRQAKNVERNVSYTKWRLRYALVQKALKKQPEHPKHLTKLAIILPKLKDKQELLRATERYAVNGFRHSNSQAAEAHCRLVRARADLLWNNGTYEQALALINSALKWNRSDHSLLHQSLYWQLCIAKTENRCDIIEEQLLQIYIDVEKQQLLYNFKKAHLAAEAMTRLGLTDKARAILSKFEENPMALLALSNTAIDDDRLWLEYVNRFFSSQQLETLHLDQGERERFFRLEGTPADPCTGGPIISVIMTAFNVESYIETAIRSALAQTWQNFELLIVDDCSTDGTRRIVKELMQQDSRIKLIENSKNCGTYINRNKAYDLATGEYVTCHDSDDWAHPRKLEYQVAALLKNPEAISSSSHWVRVNENGHFLFHQPGTFAQYNANSLMFRIDRVKPVLGYWDSVRVSADSEFIKRLQVIFGKKWTIMLDEVLMLGLKRSESLTSASGTGHRANGISPLRKQYHDSYTEWHKTIDRNSAYIDYPMIRRPFEAPEEITAHSR